MQHKNLYEQAKFIDRFAHQYMLLKKRKKFPQKEVRVLIEMLFKQGRYLGRGDCKTAYRVKNLAKDAVLKVGHDWHLSDDKEVYNSLPRSIRNRYFAKIFWRTKHTLLQEYGKPVKVPKAEMKKLKQMGKQFHLWDLKPSNICLIDGRYKIIDARTESMRKKKEKKK